MLRPFKEHKTTSESCWVEIENHSELPVLVRKYQKVEFFSSQRLFHPQEKGMISQGSSWRKPFTAKIFSVDSKMKNKLLFKLKVDRLYRVIISPDSYSCKTIKPTEVDQQIVSYHRMEEVWDNSNYYETLRIPQTATAREIRIAYLKLAKEYHPDHNKNPNATLMFERINEAYNTLSDEEVRQQYDVHLRTASGALSKSYWRQLFCHWNRDKAVQVGISTLLTVTGSALLLATILAAPTGAGLPASMVTGAIGGGIFASGIGGLSHGLSRRSAMEGNKDYKRWLKYSFWYGIAGCAAGAASAGVTSFLGPAIASGAGSIAATGAVNGAIYGLCFQGADGVASDRWVQLVKKLRVDAIALDLALATITGASLGLVFHAALMASRPVLAVANQAKYGAKYFVAAGQFAAQENEQKNCKLLEKGVQQGLIETKQEEPEEDTEEQSKEDFLPPELDNFLQCEEESVECINEAIELYEAVVGSEVGAILQFHDETRATTVRMVIEYLLPDEEGEGLTLFSQTYSSAEVCEVPPSATMIQISFERSGWNGSWSPVKTDGVSVTFNYEKPTTRRFFLAGFKKNICVSQLRDQFEQIIAS